jgi:hypothetical protein
MTFDEWKSIYPDAAADLAAALIFEPDAGMLPTELGPHETQIQAAVRLEASAKGGRLWRNNVGVLRDSKGRPVRYGLCNDSPRMNASLKSADLIGPMPVIVTPDMIGQTIGRFTSREVKAADWHYTGTDREIAQLKWAALVNSLGGDAKIVNSTGSL